VFADLDGAKNPSLDNNRRAKIVQFGRSKKKIRFFLQKNFSPTIYCPNHPHNIIYNARVRARARKSARHFARRKHAKKNLRAPRRQNMGMFLQKDGYVFAKTWVCFQKNMPMFWRRGGIFLRFAAAAMSLLAKFVGFARNFCYLWRAKNMRPR